MSLSVRFPNGNTVIYNSANQLYHEESGWHLFSGLKEKGGNWIAAIQVSAGAIIETASPCKISSSLEDAIRQVNDALKSQQINDAGGLLRKTKRLLRKFNATKRSFS